MSTVIDTLIYDRTDSDVQRVHEINNKIVNEGLSALTPAEMSEYTAGMKGAYNYTDLNRIGEAIAYIATLFSLLGESMDVAPKTDWNRNDVPSKTQMNRLLLDLTALSRQAKVTSPIVPTSLDKITRETANDIEKILFLAHENIYQSSIDQNYTGIYYSGE